MAHKKSLTLECYAALECNENSGENLEKNKREGGEEKVKCLVS
jgi:hypothetical protein